MSNHFIVPTFNKSIENKVHNELAVTGQNTVSNPTRDANWFSAIATESFPSTVDGEYVFAVRIDNAGEKAYIMIGVTPMETFDANKDGYPGWNGMTGSALDVCDGNYMPDDSQNLIDSKITKKAKEVIVVVTIANNGAQKLIRWIVDGTSSVNRDCTADCKGDKLFPLVNLGDKKQVITTIPLDQINDEVNKLITKCSNQSSTNQSAVARNAVALAQLQQELEKERKRADLAESQLQQKDQELVNEQKVTASLASQVQQKDQQLQQQASEITQLKQQLLAI